MQNETVATVMAQALTGRRLLEHRFYRRWEAGELRDGELQRYAEQYRHFEAELPTLLRTMLDAAPEGRARELIASNLADEEGTPVPHLRLFDDFARAVGAGTEVAPKPAMAALLDAYRELASAGTAPGLAGLIAYETQAPEVSSTKADGLRRHYSVAVEGTAFWDLHATMDLDHAAWGAEALAELDGDGAVIGSAAALAAGAWWNFLDEREAEAAIAV